MKETEEKDVENLSQDDVKKRKEIYARTSENIRYLREAAGLSQQQLLDRIKQKRGFCYQQPYLARIENGKPKSIPALFLALICDALEVDVKKVMWEKLGDDFLEEKKSEEKNKLVYVSKMDEFKPYLGKFHAYFYSNVSSESNKELIHAELEFEEDTYTRKCFVRFKIPLEKKDKEYKGRMILSPTYNCCYCYLSNESYGEMSYLMFEGLATNEENISCKMASVLTPAAGGTRYPTSHRMFLSRKKLSQEGIEFIKPHLTMNTAEIMISDDMLEEVMKEFNVPKDFADTIKSLTKPEQIYRIREEHFFGFGKRNMPNYDKFKFITALRAKSYANHYYKIGKKINVNLHNYMYGSKEHKEFFVDEE